MSYQGLALVNLNPSEKFRRRLSLATTCIAIGGRGEYSLRRQYTQFVLTRRILMEKTLDLEPFKRRAASLSEEVRVASETLNIAQQKLSDFERSANQDICNLIEKGKTTGDPLYDECLLQFGLEIARVFVDEKVVPHILKFNQKLVSAGGKKCLIAISGRKRVRWGGPGDSSEQDYISTTCRILGTLSGKRLEISSHEKRRGLSNVRISFPFSRYVTSGLEESEIEEGADKRPIKGRLVLFPRYSSDGLSSVDLLHGITGKESVCSIAIEGIDSLSFPPGLLSRLNSPTEDEVHRAENI